MYHVLTIYAPFSSTQVLLVIWVLINCLFAICYEFLIFLQNISDYRSQNTT